MAKFSLPTLPAGFTGPDAKLRAHCARFMELYVLEQSANQRGSGITDPQLDMVCRAARSAMDTIASLPAPVTSAGHIAKAGVAHAALMGLAPMSKVPWQEQVNEYVRFAIYTLHGISAGGLSSHAREG